ncbi:FHA domain-containing protein [Chlamydiales bacterium]|nr:FHA domain-containing protein [Chlamydiales bacterium]
MFELKIQRDSTLSYTFDQPRLIIGSSATSDIDLTLTDEGIEHEHLAILWNGHDYVAENIVNDPHTLINGIPFWKKKLNNSDVIKLGKTTITFKKIQNRLKDDPPETLDFNESKQLEKESISKKTTLKKVIKKSLQKKLLTASESRWHLWVLFISVLSVFILLFSTSFYITITERIAHQRLTTGRSLSDVAVTLKYAAEHKIVPSDKNWLDPHFLEEVGEKILPNYLTNYDWIDKEGSFKDTPYLLRVYSNPSFSRFLLIAQPQANLFQWILPKTTIVVDSKTMTLREFSNVRDLNRLLVNMTGFDGLIENEIEELFEKTNPISLKELAKGREHLGYRPPDELAIVNPEAELFLYNAPRYYQWNESIIELVNDSDDPNKLKKLAKLIEAQSYFKDMVYYTPKGIESAIHARKIIFQEIPESTPLLGYIEFSADHKISESHLLMMNQNSFSETSSVDDLEDNAVEESHDESQPLLEELKSLQKSREERIAPYTESIINLLNKHLLVNDRQFFLNYQNLYQEYQKTLLQEQNLMDQAIKILYQKFVSQEKKLSFSTFLSYLDDLEIDLGYEESSIILHDPLFTYGHPDDQINELFRLMRHTNSIYILDQTAACTNSLLSPENFPDAEKLTSWKKQLKLMCIYKLETLLWLPNLNEQTTSQIDLLWTLNRILKNGYISDPDGRQFYLSQIFIREEN